MDTSSGEGASVTVTAHALVALVAALHVCFLVLEMFLWERPPGRALSGFDAKTAHATAPLAANQGLYNGFLAAGLVWGLAAPDPTGHGAQVFFLVCVVVAGLYGGATANRRIYLAQALPGALALVAVLVAG
jgi:putative membrane protein